MYEYKVLELSVRKCEEQLNEAAKQGWRLVTMVPNPANGFGVVATLEKKVGE